MADEETTETTEEVEVETTETTTTTRADGPPSDDAEIEEWKAYARKWEDRAKKTPDSRKIKAAEKRAAEAERRIAEIEAENQTDQEKALNEAVEKAKAEARGEYETERRNDRLEVAVTRLGAKAFADVDDALLHVQRGIASGDIDADDIFNDEGKVQTESLQKALDDLLERKPHLKADQSGGRLNGDGDGGKGRGDGGIEAMSVDDHFKRISRAGSGR